MVDVVHDLMNTYLILNMFVVCVYLNIADKLFTIITDIMLNVIIERRILRIWATYIGKPKNKVN